MAWKSGFLRVPWCNSCQLCLSSVVGKVWGKGQRARRIGSGNIDAGLPTRMPQTMHWYAGYVFVRLTSQDLYVDYVDELVVIC